MSIHYPLSINWDGNIVIGGTLEVDGDLTVGTDVLVVDVSQGGVGINKNPDAGVAFDVTTGSGEVIAAIKAGDDSDASLVLDGGATTDSFIEFQVNTGTQFTFGIDNSDSNKLVFSNSASLGTNNRIEIETNGNTFFKGPIVDISGIISCSVDGSSIFSAGSITFGASNDASVYFDGTNLVLDSPTGAGLDNSVNGTSVGTWDAGGIDIVTGDTYAINGTDVLSSNTLGSTVLSSSLTSLGTLHVLDITGDLTVDTDTLFVDASANNIGINKLPTAGITLDVITDTGEAVAKVQAGDDSAASIVLDGGLTTDAFLELQVNAVTQYTVGIDNSDSDKLVFSNSASLGTNNRLEIETGGNASFKGALDATGDLTIDTNTLMVDVSGKNIGINKVPAATHLLDMTTDSGDAIIELKAGDDSDASIVIHGGATTDSFLEFKLDSGTAFTIGIDNSDSNKLVFSNSATLGVSNRFTLEPNGVAAFRGGDFSVDTNTLLVDISTKNIGINKTPASGVTLDITSDSGDCAVEIKPVADAKATLVLDAGATSDAQVEFQDNNTAVWTMGMDSTDTNALVIANSSALGTTNRLSMSTAGDMAIGIALEAFKLRVGGQLHANHYVVQNAVDGGSTRGILMWTGGDTNWGIYMADVNSLSDGSACNGDGFSGHATRFRSTNGATQGFIWENQDERRNMSIRGSDAFLSLNGEMYIGNGADFGAGAHDSMLHVNQVSATGAIPCVLLEQNDVSEPFMCYEGTAAANATNSISTLNTSGATTDHIQIDLNGVKAWIAVSTNDPT